MSEVEQVLTPSLSRLALRTPTLPPATATNCYLYSEDGALWVLEPATPYEEEQALLWAAVDARLARGQRLQGALLTHHHSDHVGAAEALRARYGVPVVAHPRTQEKLARRGVSVDRTLEEGELLGSARLLHTPGHAPGHLCAHHAGERWLVAGDMVASEGTILIDPGDDGDMHEYLAQLERLAGLELALLLPAHGAPVTEAREKLLFYVQHRLAREAKVEAALRERPGSTAEELVPLAYADTPPALYPLAARSALAHLERLRRLGRATVDGARYDPAPLAEAAPRA